MIKVDLITGFLGAGKTTFVRGYAEYLLARGNEIGIIENDFGAVNVDVMLLQDLESDHCDVQQIVGSNVVSDWKRRFKAKLVSMAMLGYDRIVVEPSGIYDVEAFFDVLYDEPVNKWYEVGSIITIVDAGLEEELSRQEEYLIVSQLAHAGKILMSKTEFYTVERVERTLSHLENIMARFHCKKELEEALCLKKWSDFSVDDYAAIAECGWNSGEYEKLWFDQNELFTTLYFMELQLTEAELMEAVKRIFSEEKCRGVARIKGFCKADSGEWLQVNASRGQVTTRKVPVGQDVLIVVGKDITREDILQQFHSVCTVNL